MRCIRTHSRRGEGRGTRDERVSPAARLAPHAPNLTVGGFTLIEMMLGASIIAIISVALMGGYLGQSYLNENARNLTMAMNDTTRVMERIRQQNTGSTGTCGLATPIPSARPPSRESWNAWMDTQAGTIEGKSIGGANSNRFEIIAVTCQDETGLLQCGRNQAGRYEWLPSATGLAGTASGTTEFDPIRVTVAIGWAQRRSGLGNLTFGAGSPEFTYRVTGGGKNTVTTADQLTVGPDADNDRVIESPAMLTTLITCR